MDIVKLDTSTTSEELCVLNDQIVSSIKTMEETYEEAARLEVNLRKFNEVHGKLKNQMSITRRGMRNALDNM